MSPEAACGIAGISQRNWPPCRTVRVTELTQPEAGSWIHLSEPRISFRHTRRPRASQMTMSGALVVQGRPPRDSTESGPLLLAIEARSPSSTRVDRDVKRRLYQREGVAEYWIVDRDGCVMERWRPGDGGPVVLDERITRQPKTASEAMVVELGEFFAGMGAG